MVMLGMEKSLSNFDDLKLGHCSRTFLNELILTSNSKELEGVPTRKSPEELLKKLQRILPVFEND